MIGYQSWGNYPPVVVQHVERLYWRPAQLPGKEQTILPYGLGRSQGDSCLNEGGWLLDTSHLNHFIAFDAATGEVTCEAGVTLADILETFFPRGWMLPVVPGTKYVTVGGAIANDVHGKNHYQAGAFGSYVKSFELVRSDGVYHCSPTNESQLFAATLAGLGLTGLITSATIQLQRVDSPWITTEVFPFQSLREGIHLIQQQATRHHYAVGQFDALPGSSGKGVLMAGDSAPNTEEPIRRSQQIAVPRLAPNWILNDAGMRLFNWWYYHSRAHQRRPRVVYYEPYFFPLDNIAHWNRLYGKHGFLQYQSVVPSDQAVDVYEAMLAEITKMHHGSYLASLKIFGNKQSLGMLSFPRPGIVVALDFPFRGQATLDLLEKFDLLVRAAHGAVYPAKDARMSAQSFKAYFPRWQEFSQLVDPSFSSSFWRRVTGGASHVDLS